MGRRFIFQILFILLGSLSLHAQGVKEWTVLVYLNADNDLYKYGFLNMFQMEQVGSTDQMNVVVQFDHETRNIPTQRIYVTKAAQPVNGKISSTIVESLPETDMGNPQTLADFLAWGIQKYPAKKYAVVIWNHGSGWEGVSYDDNPSTHLTMPQVRMALEQTNTLIARQRGMRSNAAQIDLINFDACLMSALEVAYELQGTGKVLVGSQFTEPGEGENYKELLTPMAAKPTMTAREVAELMVYQYTLGYQSRSQINYAAIDLTKVASYTNTFNQTIGIGANSPLKADIRRAFGVGSFDLVTGLNSARKAIHEESSPVADAFDKVIADYGYPAEAVQRSVNLRDSSLVITRNSPGRVYYRFNLNEGWRFLDLQTDGSGSYSVRLQNRPVQHYVLVAQKNSRSQVSWVRESLTTIVRDGNNPIVFHNQFPETSPLIADSYSMSTRGAHGMTLYSLAGWMSTFNTNSASAGRAMLANYKDLLFAKQGAPNWTSFFGL